MDRAKSSPGLRVAQQFIDVAADRAFRHVGRIDHPQPTLLIDQVGYGRMVDEIFGAARIRVRLEVEAVVLAEGLDGRRVAGQANKGWIETGKELLEDSRLIALAVDADENKRNLLGGVAQRSLDPFPLGERRRTDIRTVGIAEKEQHRPPVEIAQTEGCTCLAGKREVGERLGWVDRRAAVLLGQALIRGRTCTKLCATHEQQTEDNQEAHKSS